VVRHLLLIPALAAALVAAGCGSGSKNDYVQSVNKAEASLQKSLTSLSSISATSSGAQVANTLENGGNALDAAADNFNEIKPPDDAKNAHAKIVDGLHKLAGTFREAADAAKSKDPTKLVQTLTDITSSDGAKELEAAEKELIANGYKVQGAS